GPLPNDVGRLAIVFEDDPRMGRPARRTAEQRRQARIQTHAGLAGPVILASRLRNAARSGRKIRAGLRDARRIVREAIAGHVEMTAARRIALGAVAGATGVLE